VLSLLEKVTAFWQLHCFLADSRMQLCWSIDVNQYLAYYENMHQTNHRGMGLRITFMFHRASCIVIVEDLFPTADNRQEGIEAVNEIVAVGLSGDANFGTLLYVYMLPLSGNIC